jgi:hypothetical protein
MVSYGGLIPAIFLCHLKTAFAVSYRSFMVGRALLAMSATNALCEFLIRNSHNADLYFCSLQDKKQSQTIEQP